MEQLNEILQDIYSSVSGTEFIGIINTEEGMTVSIWTEKWKDSSDIIAAALSEISRFIEEKKEKARNKTIREALQGFVELIIETENSYFLLLQLEGTNYCVGAGINKAGNIGLLRSKVRLVVPRIKDLLV